MTAAKRMPIGKVLVVMTSTLFDVLGSEWFCVTAARGLGEADVVDRLAAAGPDPLPRYPIDGVAEHVSLDSWTVRVYCPEGSGWAYVFDALPQVGVPFREPVLKELSRGTEAVSAWKFLDGTTRVAHACDGEILALFDSWRFDPASGKEPDRLNRALDRVGFFLDEPGDDAAGRRTRTSAQLHAVGTATRSCSPGQPQRVSDRLIPSGGHGWLC